MDNAEATIDSLEEQAAELQKQTTKILENIDNVFNNLPGYEDLKRKAKKLAENAGKVLDDIDQKISEVVDEIPDTLVCD